MNSLIKTKARIKNNGEVFTPNFMVKYMVSLCEPEISLPKSTILEPSVGIGNFLVEILKLKLENCKNEDDVKMSLKSLCGVDISLDNILETRKRLKLLVKDKLDEKEIDFILENNILLSDFLLKEHKTSFDIIIGNPPYQLKKHQLYADFYKKSTDMNPKILCMIFPCTWQMPSNSNGLKVINNKTYKRDKHLILIDNYDENQKIFENIRPGPLNVVLRKNNYNNNGKIRLLNNSKESGTIFLPITNEEYSRGKEIDSLRENIKNKQTLNNNIKIFKNPYNLSPKFLLQENIIDNNGIKVYGFVNGRTRGMRIVKSSLIKKYSPIFNSYKALIPKVWGNMKEFSGKIGGAYAKIVVVGPEVACTETFLEIGPFNSREEAYRFAKYMMTRVARAFLLLEKITKNLSVKRLKNLPFPDINQDYFNKNIIEIENELFKEYQINNQVSSFIKDNIQQKTENDIIIL